jgi:hypothetical protein
MFVYARCPPLSDCGLFLDCPSHPLSLYRPHTLSPRLSFSRYEYVYSSNDLRLEWGDDWASVYPWVPTPQNANETVQFKHFCEAACADGWTWLNASEWLVRCREQAAATGMDVLKCTVSAYPQVDVSILSRIAFQREGTPITPGQFLGIRSEQYSFGGCWPCNHLYCAPGYGAGEDDACVMR